MLKALIWQIKSLTAKFAPETRGQHELERRVQQLLDTHSHCSETIVIASPDLRSAEYACFVSVPSSLLFAWLQKHRLSISNIGIEGQASREFLYRWLAGADFSDEQVVDLPSTASAIVAPYIRQFVEESLAIVLCAACDRIVNDIQIRESERHVESAYTVWGEAWLCPCGQVICKKTHKARLIMPWRSDC